MQLQTAYRQHEFKSSTQWRHLLSTLIIEGVPTQLKAEQKSIDFVPSIHNMLDMCRDKKFLNARNIKITNVLNFDVSEERVTLRSYNKKTRKTKKIPVTRVTIPTILWCFKNEEGFFGKVIKNPGMLIPLDVIEVLQSDKVRYAITEFETRQYKEVFGSKIETGTPVQSFKIFKIQ